MSWKNFRPEKLARWHQKNYSRFARNHANHSFGREMMTYLWFWFPIFDKHVESIIRDGNSGFIWINCTKWEIFGWDGTFGQDVKKCWLANIGESDDTNLQVCSHSTKDLWWFWGFLLFLWRHGDKSRNILVWKTIFFCWINMCKQKNLQVRSHWRSHQIMIEGKHVMILAQLK